MGMGDGETGHGQKGHGAWEMRYGRCVRRRSWCGKQRLLAIREFYKVVNMVWLLEVVNNLW